MATLRKSEQTQDQLTFWSEELPAKPSPLPDYVGGSAIAAATSHSNFLDWLSDSSPYGWCGRTSPACYQAFRTTLPIRCRRTSTWTYSKTERKWKLKTSTTQKSYTHSTACWPDFQNSGMGGHTGFLTLNTLEFHSAAVASSLSDILETGDLPRRYYLTPTACRGILRRAEKRGKRLPEKLVSGHQRAIVQRVVNQKFAALVTRCSERMGGK